MIQTLIVLLIVALILGLIYYVAAWFVQGRILQIVGAVLALLWILYALSALGILSAI